MSAKLSFQVSPIWLTGPPVSNWPGDMMPIIAITDPTLFTQQASVGATGGIGSDFAASSSTAGNADLDNSFGAFTVLPGGSLVKQTPATYPFANQMVAANATIFEPLEVSLIWDTPMRGTNAWGTKMGVIGQLQAALTYHNNNGGLYTVTTPSFIYTNMIMTNMADASRSTSPIPQNAWRFDFVKPLVSLTDLAAAQSALMTKLSNGLLTTGNWSGVGSGIGSPTPLPQFTLPALSAVPQ